MIFAVPLRPSRDRQWTVRPRFVNLMQTSLPLNQVRHFLQSMPLCGHHLPRSRAAPRKNAKLPACPRIVPFVLKRTGMTAPKSDLRWTSRPLTNLRIFSFALGGFGFAAGLGRRLTAGVCGRFGRAAGGRRGASAATRRLVLGGLGADVGGAGALALLAGRASLGFGGVISVGAGTD